MKNNDPSEDNKIINSLGVDYVLKLHKEGVTQIPITRLAKKARQQKAKRMFEQGYTRVEIEKAIDRRYKQTKRLV